MEEKINQSKKIKEYSTEKLEKIKDKPFKPQLITNDPIPEDAPFPRIVSEKRHGICVIVHPDYDVILGRSLKPIKNIQFQERFKPVLSFCKEKNYVLHAEAHIEGCISDDMTHFLNTIDLNNISKKSKEEIKKNIEIGKYHLKEEDYYILPEEMKLYAFDCVNLESLEQNYVSRIVVYLPEFKKFDELVELIPQITIQTQEEEDRYYEEVMKKGGEGLVIRYNKPYKFGRTSPKDLIAYKRLPINTFDGKIIAINQATEVNPEAEKTINELGYSVTSKKKDDRVLIEQAKDFQVEMTTEKGETIDFGVSMKGFNHDDRKEVWKNPQDYVGRWIEFESKEYKGIGRPKSAKFIRFRDDKE